MSLIVPNKHHN